MTLLGIDYAKWQLRDLNNDGKFDPLNWDLLCNNNIKFAVGKCTHGKWSADPAAPLNWKLMEGKLTRGLYHWITGDKPEEQVNYFLNNAEKIGWTADDLPLCVDFEEPNIALRGEALINHLRKIVELIEFRTNKPCIIYSGSWYWQGYCNNLDAPDLANKLYWHAAYPRVSVKDSLDYLGALDQILKMQPTLPAPWAKQNKKQLFWQFDGDKGLVLPGGVDSDFNVFYGSEEDLKNLCKMRLNDPTTAVDFNSLPPALDLTPEESFDAESLIAKIFEYSKQ